MRRDAFEMSPQLLPDSLSSYSILLSFFTENFLLPRVVLMKNIHHLQKYCYTSLIEKMYYDQSTLKKPIYGS